MRIRKGDRSRCSSGKYRGKRGQVDAWPCPPSGQVIVDGREHGQAPRQAQAGRPCRAASSTSTCRSRCRRGDRLPACDGPTRIGMQDRRDGPQGPGLPQVRERSCEDRRHDRPRGPASRSATSPRCAPSCRGTLGLGNIMEVPRLEKIVINMGVGKATQQQSLIEGAVRDLEMITGQKPIVTRAKKSIANFKLREGMPSAPRSPCAGDRAWEFFDRLISLAIPRIRDFRGLSPRRSTAAATTPSASPNN